MVALTADQRTRRYERLQSVARRVGDVLLEDLLRGFTAPDAKRKKSPPTEDSKDLLSTRLMEAFRVTGDDEVYECLYDESRGILRRMILARLRHVSPFLDVNDILQDTYVNIYRYPRRFRANRPTAFRDWVGTIVQNTIRRHLKKQMRDARRYELAGERIEEREDPHGEPVDEISTGEQQALLRKGFYLLLSAYLQAYRMLGSRDQKILHLVEVKGLLYREAAVDLGVRPENMKMLVFRARRKVYRVMSRFLEAA